MIYNNVWNTDHTMNFASSPFQVRLQDLKLWQGNYDNLLHYKSKSSLHPSDYETIEGISALDTTNSSVSSPKKSLNFADWDKKPISPLKPFEQLLEEKLAEEKPVEVVAKPKRPFLRKGEGLVRYKLKPVQKKVQKCNSVSVKPINPKPVIRGILKNAIPTSHSEIDLTPLKMPDFIIKPKGTWHRVVHENEEVITPITKEQETDDIVDQKRKSSIKEDVNIVGPKNNQFNARIIEKINEFALRNFSPKSGNSTKAQYKPGDQTLYEEQLEKELRLFEKLEERVENSSFCSTSTSIVNMLSSTPNKAKQPVIVEERVLELEDRCFSVPKNNEPCLNLQQKLNEVAKKTDVLQHFLLNLKNMNIDANKRSANASDSRRSASPKIIRRGSYTHFSDDERWSSNTESRSQSPSSVYSDYDTTYKTDTLNRVNVAINTSFNSRSEDEPKGMCLSCETLRSSLEKINKELPNIQAEKARVMDFAKELEKKRDELNREMAKMKKEHEEQVTSLQEELEAAMMKITKDKKFFEKYVKDSQNRPSRKEREEITNLKQELADAKELMKMKDTKNGAMQARLRNNIKQLEKEVSELKSEIEKLQKENAKLSASQKLARRPSDVKVLHEINKNLTKLAEETFKKQLEKSGSSGEGEGIAKKTKKKNYSEDGNGSVKSLGDFKAKNNIESKQTWLQNDGIESVRELENTKDDNLSVEKQYENVFGQFNSPKENSSHNGLGKGTFKDGSMEISYSNGNVKTVSPDGNLIIIKYFNGDIKETNVSKKTIRYYYMENGSWHTQFEDGSELIEYADGQTSRKHKDGKIEINYADGSIRTINPDGTEEQNFPDGSKTIKNEKGEQIILLPNGQREIHTKDHKRREYPDGTVRHLYSDGTVRTQYANGRVRVKDPQGNLILDYSKTCSP